MINDLFQLNALANILKVLIPEGIDKNVVVDGVEYSITNKDGKIEINVNEKFDDAETKNQISQFKENIQSLDDCPFLKITEEYGKNYNVKELDELLNLDNYTQEEAEKVLSMICDFTDIVKVRLQEEIKKLIKIYKKF